MWKPRQQPGPPGTPMRVIGVGLPRTGTSSFTRALEILLESPVYHAGIQTVRLSQASKPLAAERNILRWIDILSISRARLSDPATYTVSEAQRQKYLLAQILEGYAAAMDTPVCLYAKELRELYPDAKFIVTIRDEDSWWESYRQMTQFTRNPWLGLSWWPIPGMRHYRQYIRVMRAVRWGKLRFTQDEVATEKVMYARHMEYLQRELGDMMYFFNVKDGWAPLCEILEVDVPDIPFPHLNDATALQQAFASNTKAGQILWAGILGGAAGTIFMGWRMGLFHLLKHVGDRTLQVIL